MNIQAASEFIARSQSFWWRRQRLTPRAHAILMHRSFVISAIAIFVADLLLGVFLRGPRLVHYGFLASFLLLIIRAARFQRVIALFEKSGPHTFDDLQRATHHEPAA